MIRHHDHLHAHGPVSTPSLPASASSPSLLRASVGQRLAGATVISGMIWLTILWAIA